MNHLINHNKMQSEKLFINPELTLNDLAAALNVLPNHLSQVINSKENKNFYDYINQLRVEEFIRLIALSENQKFTLLSLAYECGFNSKTSFNRNFKKVTDLTPSEYIKQEKIGAWA
ncbi:MAG: AraC family transcriptional regulator [Bacteroidia bacterium]|nr:AraC family transcriptional regulator [Bacteroidia bacterium]